MHPGESHRAVTQNLNFGNRAIWLRAPKPPTEATVHPRSAKLTQARNNDCLGSMGGLRARVIHAWGVCAAHRALATPTERRLLPRQDRLSHSNREAQAMRARQDLRTSCHEPREAVHRGGCNAQRRAAPFWPVTNGSECRPQPPAAAGACGMGALPCKCVHFGAEATRVHAGGAGCAGMVGFDVSRDTGHARGQAKVGSGRLLPRF
jgi:hypothetical protein